jgi:hypothetical protein
MGHSWRFQATRKVRPAFAAFARLSIAAERSYVADAAALGVYLKNDDAAASHGVDTKRAAAGL